MKALQKEKPGPGLVLKDLPIPKIKDHEVLIKMRASGICGTDVHIYNWDKWSQNRIKPPVITGHEFCGDVVEVGKAVKNISLGLRVSAEGHITCGHCVFCRTGQGHICRDVEIIGVDRDGCFAEYLAMDAANLWPVHPDIPDHIAAIFDPIGNAMHTVMSEPVSAKSVLISGAGAIGIFSVAIARNVGATTIFVTEPNPLKREWAKKLGADFVLDPSTDNIDQIVLDNTGGVGPHILLEMSGNQHAMRTGFKLLRNGGTACLLGIPSEPMLIDWGKDIIFKGITLKAITGRRMYETWYQSQDFLLKHKEHIDKLITHRLPFADFKDGFDALNDGSAVKAVLEF